MSSSNRYSPEVRERAVRLVFEQHLGHSSIVITMDRYGHLYPEDRSKVTDALDAAFTAARKATA